MQGPDYLPENSEEIGLASNLATLFDRNFKLHESCILLPGQALTPGFNLLARTLAKQVDLDEHVASFDEYYLRQIKENMKQKFSLFASQISAIDTIMEDMEAAYDRHMNPMLRVVGTAGYTNEGGAEIETFHEDGHEQNSWNDKVLRIYTHPGTEILLNRDAIFIGLDGDGARLYEAGEGAALRSQPGDWIRLRCLSKQGKQNLCIHRGQPAIKGHPPKMLLVCEHMGEFSP